MEINKIYNEDCLDGMKRIKDKSVDMILCDLPYGTTQNKWDNVIPFEELWKHYERVIKENGAIVLFAQTPFDKMLGYSNYKLLRYEWIWEKTYSTGHLNAKKMPMKKHENILVFYKKLPTYNPQMLDGKPYTTKRGTKSENYGKDVDGYDRITVNNGVRYPTSILKFGKDKGFHPTQKPLKLIEYLIKTYTNENELVLDNCMGSGTTAVACKNLNRNFIGFEISKEYCDIANKRLGVNE